MRKTQRTMAKKNSRKSVTKNLATSYFTAKKTRRHAVCLSEKQVPMKIEGVRMKRSRWVAEIKHPKKKNVRMWIGSFATQEEASKAYQSKKMEHERLKLRAIARKDKLVDDQEVVSGLVESYSESLPDNSDVVVKLADFDDQVAKLVGLEDANIVESHGESQRDDCDVSVNVIGSDDQATEVIHIDYQTERSLSRRIVGQEAVDMLLQSGPILMDRYGCLLGEFSWMDDLSIV